jgi:hypothetical protein
MSARSEYEAIGASARRNAFRARTAGALFLLGAAACGGGDRDRSLPEEVAGAWWLAVARDGGHTLLVSRDPPHRAVAHAGGRFREVELTVVELDLPGVPPERARPLAVGSTTLNGREVRVQLPGRSPALEHPPADPSLAAFGEDDHLWLLEAGGVRRLTVERTAGFALEELRARQREGEVILYWAAVPVWSPDARRIAYVTNREAVAAGRSGQSVWVLEVASGVERPLLEGIDVSYRPVGWLGGELLVIGGDPGLWAVDPASGARRLLAEGMPIATTTNGSAVAVAAGWGAETAIRVITSEGAEHVAPPPAAGWSFAQQGALAPDGRRLLLQAGRGGWTERWYLVHDAEGGELIPVGEPGPAAEAWPVWLDGEQLLVPVRGANGEARSRLVRLP